MCGAEQQHSVIENQILAIYSALQTVMPKTQTAVVGVKTTLPVQEWVKDLMHSPKAEVAQAQTVAHWVAYLWQHRHLSPSPLNELQKILGPVMYHSDAPGETTPEEECCTGRKIPFSRKYLVPRWVQQEESK